MKLLAVTLSLIAISVVTAFSNFAFGAWGYVKKDYYCKTAGDLDSMKNSFIGFQFDQPDHERNINYYSKVSREVVTPFLKSLCVESDIKYAGDMLQKANERCVKACDEGNGNQWQIDSCKKYCKRAFNEGFLLMEGYAWGLTDATGNPSWTSGK